jgi:hypothetical protein
MYGILDAYDNFYSLYVVHTRCHVIKNLVFEYYTNFRLQRVNKYISKSAFKKF